MTRPDTKHHSQSNELTGSLVASDTASHVEESHTPTIPSQSDFMYEWIRRASGK